MGREQRAARNTSNDGCDGRNTRKKQGWMMTKNGGADGVGREKMGNGGSDDDEDGG